MRFDTKFFRSKLARRMLLMFMICALVPISALAAVSFAGVSEQLREQGQQRLRRASKSQGMSIIARLQFLEAEMKSVATRINKNFAAIETLPAKTLGEGPHARFHGMSVVSATGTPVPVLIGVKDLPELAEIQRQYDRAGTVICSHSSPGSGTRVFMATPLDPQRPRGMLLAEINTVYLWGTQALTASTEICIVDESQRVIFSSQGVPASFLANIARDLGGASGEFKWNDEEYIASYWTIFLRGSFLAPNWTVVLSKSKTDVLAPVASFRRTFSLVLLLTLWVVLLLSFVHIRRSLHPLAALRDATRSIAARDLKTRVTSVKSGDEFEELATSFNSMAQQLERHFRAMTARTGIDRAILSALDAEKIVETVLTRLPEVVPCDCVAVTLFDAGAVHTTRTYVIEETVARCARVSRLKPGELRQLQDHPGGVAVDNDDDGPPYLAPLAARGGRFTYILPVFLSGDVAAALVLGYREPSVLSQDDRDNGRQLADQVAVGLSMAALVGKLRKRTEDLSETNRALERAIVDRERKEQEIIQVQKMESVGRLAGGIAHDLNNKLAVVIGLTQLGLQRMTHEDPMRSDLVDVRDAAEQAVALTDQLLAFGRKQVLNPQAIDLNALVGKSVKMMKRVIGANIRLVFVQENDSAIVKVDPVQMEQVLMNLLVNARDAMPAGGTITLTTSTCSRDRHEQLGRLSVDGVRLSVADTGTGMDKETLARIFEPFFTTKPKGKGTGLGMAVTHGIVTQSGGEIRVQSAVGRGTTFDVYLPGATLGGRLASTAKAVVSGGSEMILVVDDEQNVREVLTRVLAEKGYAVLVASDGREALAQLRANQGLVSLLLTDMVMPGMSGMELVREVQSLFPDVSVVCMSAHFDQEADEALRDRDLPSLKKPARPDVVCQMVRDALDAQRSVPTENVRAPGDVPDRR